jgi:hypothetical protein
VQPPAIKTIKKAIHTATKFNDNSLITIWLLSNKKNGLINKAASRSTNKDMLGPFLFRYRRSANLAVFFNLCKKNSD